MATKKKTTKKQATRPRTKTVYREKIVYVKQKEEGDDPFGNVNKMIGTGMGAVIGVGIAGAVVKSLKEI